MLKEEKKTDELTSEEKAAQTKIEATKVSEVADTIKQLEKKIDEIIETGSIGALTVLAMIVTGFSKNTQSKILLVLRRDPEIRELIDEKEAKKQKE